MWDHEPKNYTKRNPNPAKPIPMNIVSPVIQTMKIIFWFFACDGYIKTDKKELY
jgi:hypothetical protein